MKAIRFAVCCSDPQCADQPADYKVAAEWTGGGVTELKTFGFANDECLDRVMEAAILRARGIRLDVGESIGAMCIYRLDSSRHDYELERATDLEESLRKRAVPLEVGTTAGTNA